MATKRTTKGRIPSRPKSTLRLDTPPLATPPPTKKQKTKLMSSICKPPAFDLTGSQSSQSRSSQSQGVRSLPAPSPSWKGKEKEKLVPGSQGVTIAQSDELMWVDQYEPQTEEDLAVHKRKVQDVRQWLLEAFDGGPSGKLKKYRRILALTGPAGTAKTATVRVLARELGAEIVEWRNSMDEHYSESFPDDWEYEGLSDKFRNFLARAGACSTLFSSVHPGASQPPPSSASTSAVTGRRQLILLEDLPNISHAGTQEAFHAALEAFVASSDASTAPLVLVISDAGVRGEDVEADFGAWRTQKRDALDVRNVLPPALLESPYVTKFKFNPVAPTLMKRALQNVVDTHFSKSSKRAGAPPLKAILETVVESSNGDIRSALMALQFACVADAFAPAPHRSKRAKNGEGPSARAVVEAVTRREQSLALFHLLGKVLYNKRKGDPPIASASAKDVQREREADSQIPNPPRLPSHLKEHERRASRVEVETLYSDSPIDASLLSLYIHQNYTQYCNELSHCDAEADWLSWIDSSGGEAWYQANPHHFHLVTLSTLHSLPSPVTRRNQKPYKPAFFESLQKEREAGDGVRDVQRWLQRSEDSMGSGWSKQRIVLELGGVLRARDHSTAPATHGLFSRLEFSRDPQGLMQLDEEADVPTQLVPDDDEGLHEEKEAESHGGGWLEGDDIEDF